MVDDIISQEPKAERSLMHRFNIALVWITLHYDCRSKSLTQASSKLC